MKVIIPCAGYATRLYPLTKNKPKALIEVQGQPILNHIIEKIAVLNVSEIFIVTNSKFFEHFNDWIRNFKFNIPIKIIDDGTFSNEDRLGTIGDINFAVEKGKIDDDLLVIAGDNLFNFSLEDINKNFKEKNRIFNAIYDVRTIEAAKELGVVEVNEGHEIIEFEEKPENPKTTFASLGIYFFPKEKLSLFNTYLDEGNSADKMGYFMKWILNREKVHGYIYKEKWFDIGVKESLDQAHREFKK